MDEDVYCYPEKMERSNKYHSGDYSCNNCNQTDCFYWNLYNGDYDENQDELIPPYNFSKF